MSPYTDDSDEGAPSTRKGGRFHQNHLSMLADSSVDIRYLVTTCRYTITKELRHVIRSHFEDEIQTLEELERAVECLDLMATKVHDVTKLLLDSLDQPVGDENPAPSPPPSNRKKEPPDPMPKSANTVWTLDSGPLDPSVRAFQSFAVILLHLMVHKSYCVLFSPLFRDHEMSSNPTVRIR